MLLQWTTPNPAAPGAAHLITRQCPENFAQQKYIIYKYVRACVQ